VIRASFYIIVCSARNRTRMRLRRLREPRYLAGAVAGAAYLYFSIFGRFRGRRSTAARDAARRGSGRAVAEASTLLAAGPALSGMALMLLAAVSWVAPFDSGLLDFSEAETQFLFPAPVSRRQLLIHRMLRSQIGLLFGAVIFGIALPRGSGYNRLSVGIASWFLLSTAKVYFTGVSLARARIRATRARRPAAWLLVGVLVAALAIVATAMIRALVAAPWSGPADLLRLVTEVSKQPLPRVVLWPFVAMTRPLFAIAQSPGAYLTSLAGSAAILAAAVVWVLRTDEAFQDAAAEAAARRSRKAAGKRAVSYRPRAAGWKLAPAGRPEAALAWKAAMQTFRVVDRRSLARFGLILVALAAAASTTGRGGAAEILGAFAMAAAIFTILMAPQVLRIDIRQDLEHLELLKTWPIPAAAVVRGELLWPGVLITGIAWTMLAAAMILSGAVLPRVGVGWRIGSGAAFAILAPALIFAQLTVHNGLALMFPAWVPLGNQRARGVDAMGQRLIMLGGTWLLLIVMALPGALAGAIVWFALEPFFGPAMLIPAAVVCTTVIALEVLLATAALGPVYERLDITAVEPGD
jgi:ABC-2 type transport system permease protein